MGLRGVKADRAVQADFRTLDRLNLSVFLTVRRFFVLSFLGTAWINTSAGMPKVSCRLRIYSEKAGDLLA